MIANLILGFPAVSDSKESTCNAGDLGSIPGLGRSRGNPGLGQSLLVGSSHGWHLLKWRIRRSLAL